MTTHAWFFIASLLIGAGCQTARWEGGFDSPEALGRAVVAALNAGDEGSLHGLRVGAKEYVGWIYPAFPSGKPPYNFPPDFAWGNLNKKCLVGVDKWVRNYGSQDLAYVNIRFEKPVEEYGKFRLRRGTILVVRDKTGKEIEYRLLGSVVEKSGQFKLLSYQDD